MERIKKEHKDKIMEMIRKAGDPENYIVSWNDKGIPISKEKAKVERGGKSRAAGSRFELKVRRDLENKGRIVDKWTNNIDLEKGKLIIARKYNPFKKIFVLGAGFPDFITIKHVHSELYSVIGVEVKMNGVLSQIEKEKCKWYLQKQIFSQIWIAKKGSKRGEIEYINFAEKYNKK